MSRVNPAALAAALLLVAAALPGCTAAWWGRPNSKVGLTLLGSVPFQEAEQVAFDDMGKVAYVIGGTHLAVSALPSPGRAPLQGRS